MRCRGLLLFLLLVFLFAPPLFGVVLSPSASSCAVLQKPALVGGAGVLDFDGDRVADSLECLGSGVVRVVVSLGGPPSAGDLGGFEALGGVVEAVWREAVYGFAGTVSVSAIGVYARENPNVLLIEEDKPNFSAMSYAARQIGVRPYVWDTLGYRGDPNTTVAVLDTGVSLHSAIPSYGDENFSRKIVAWKDFVNSSSTEPYDDHGHGTCLASIMAGEGFESVDQLGRRCVSWSFDSYQSYFNSPPPPPSQANYSSQYINVTDTLQPVHLEIVWDNSSTVSGSIVVSYLALFYPFNGSSIVDFVATPLRNTTYSFDYSPGVAGLYRVTVMWKAVVQGETRLRWNVNMNYTYNPGFVGDGYATFTGVAPDVRLAGVKVLNSDNVGYDSDVISGIDWCIQNKLKYHIVVINLSLVGGSTQAKVDAVNHAVEEGIVVVTIAGNSGAGGGLGCPGNAEKAITVGAINSMDMITTYSSKGGLSYYGGVLKPDVVAPGGSAVYFSGQYTGFCEVFGADTSTNDVCYSDVYADNLVQLYGTSVSAAVVSGAVALIVEALGGFEAWNYTEEQALWVKQLLLMTASETNLLRELSSQADSPILDRGGKDVHEGYGRINVGAAVELANSSLQSFSGTLYSSDNPLGRHAAGVILNLTSVTIVNLVVPQTADFDLYAYRYDSGQYGEPVLVVKSTQQLVGVDESVTLQPGEYYVVVKAVEGGGVFQITLTAEQVPIVLQFLVLYLMTMQFSQQQSTTITGIMILGISGIIGILILFLKIGKR